MIKFTKLLFEDVETGDLGKNVVTIRVNEESIKHYSRKVKLLNIVESMKLSEDDEIAYRVAAGIMSICTDPKTGEYSFSEDQLSDFVNKVSGNLYTELTFANSKVNPSLFVELSDEVKTMTTKKKST